MAKKTINSRKRKEDKLVNKLLTLNEDDIRTYQGNPLLKRAGEKVELTADHIKEYKRCMDDPIYFAENYIKIVHVDKGLIPIELYDYQKRIIKALQEYRYNIVLSCRQSGKTTTMVCFILWYVMFHSDKACAILANKGATARQIVGRVELAFMNLPKWLQQGVTYWNMGSFGLENGSSVSSAATSSDSIRGSSFSCVDGNTKVTIVDDENCVWFTSINMIERISNRGTDTMYKERRYYYVYRTINLVNNKEYIGFHSTDNLDDGYMGSGKLLIRAIEKYGIENFHKDILKIFNNREEAEAYERELVNEEYVNRKDTYNLSIGGNVCILYGENNGFYGKKHTPETIAKIVKTNKEKEARGEIHHPKTLKTAPMRIGNHIFDSYRHASITLGIPKIEIMCYLYYDKNCYMLNENDQKKVCKEFEKYLIDKEERKKKHAENISKSWTAERREKYSKLFSGRKNPWNEKTNKNPEKIAKTAAKHRGMKRSPETCRKISEAAKRRFANKHKEENNNESINK